MIKSALEVFTDIEQGRLKKIYFAYGDDYFLQERLIDLLHRKLLYKFAGNLSRHVYYGDENNNKAVFNELFNYGIFSQNKFIVYKNVVRISTDEEKLLKQFIATVPEGVTLIIIFKGKNVPEFIKDYKEIIQIVDLSTPRYNKIPDLVKSYIQSHGYTIDEDAVDLLIMRCGEELGTLISEVEKITVYLGDRKDIKSEDIEKIIGFTRQYNVNNLLYYISKKDHKKMIECILLMLDAGASVPFIVSVLTNYFTDLWLYDSAKDRSNFSTISKMGYENYKKLDFGWVFKRLLEIDLKSKTTGISGKDLLLPFFAELCLL